MIEPKLGTAIWHDALTRRLRSLLKTAPFHQLRSSESRRSAVMEHDDTVALCMKALEVLVDALGLKNGADRQEIEEALLPLLAANDQLHGVKNDPKRHRQVIAAVLGTLLNDSGRRQAYEEEYLDFNQAQQPVHRLLRYKLASEQEALDGRIVIRAEADGINLFLRALDIDLEDAQAAIEAVMEVQLKRGRFDLALQAAREAQIRSIQYREQVEALEKRTRRDVGAVDWRRRVPELLQKAVAHLRDRLEVERELSAVAHANLERRLDSQEAPLLTKIIQMTEDCFRRHTELHHRLINIYQLFREEQERQRFAPIPVRNLPSPDVQLLVPLLALPAEKAGPVADCFNQATVPALSPAFLSLGTLWDRLLKPPRHVQSWGPAVPSREDLTPLSDPEPWFDEQISRRIDQSLSRLAKPVQLSRLLDHTSSHIERHFLIMRCLQHFAPEDGQTLPIQIQKDNTRFNCHDFTGDQLVVFPQERESEPTPDP